MPNLLEKIIIDSLLIGMRATVNRDFYFLVKHLKFKLLILTTW